MRYVEVPVPEELVEQVEIFLRWNVNAAPPPNVEVVGTVYPKLDDDSRRLLRFVAEAARTGDEVDLATVAHRLGLSQREAIGTVIELNAAIFQSGGPMMTVLFKDAPEPNRLPDRPLVVAEAVARVLHRFTGAE